MTTNKPMIKWLKEEAISISGSSATITGLSEQKMARGGKRLSLTLPLKTSSPLYPPIKVVMSQESRTLQNMSLLNTSNDSTSLTNPVKTGSMPPTTPLSAETEEINTKTTPRPLKLKVLNKKLDSACWVTVPTTALFSTFLHF